MLVPKKVLVRLSQVFKVFVQAVDIIVGWRENRAFPVVTNAIGDFSGGRGYFGVNEVNYFYTNLEEDA